MVTDFVWSHKFRDKYVFSKNAVSRSRFVLRHYIIFSSIYCLNNVAIAVLNGMRMQTYSFMRSLRWIALICLFGNIIDETIIGGYIYSFIISEIIVFSLLVYVFLRSKYIVGSYNPKSLKEILNYVFVYPSEFEVSFNENIDIVILESISDASLGYIVFPVKFAKSLGLIGGAIQTNFNPIISSCFKDNSIDKLKEFCIKLRSISLKIFSILIALAASAITYNRILH